MIDWLEEVLRGAQSREEQNRLLELLGQTVAVAATEQASAGVEGEPLQNRTSDTFAPFEAEIVSAAAPLFHRGELSERRVETVREQSAAGRDSAALLSPLREVMGDAVLMRLAQRAMEQGSNGTAVEGREGSVLRSLYRRAVEAVGGTPISGAAGSPVVIREEQVVTGGLTVRELDREVRRDSRRYDGGMNIY